MGSLVLVETGTLYCHGDRIAKVYNLPTNRGRWKRLYFVDECPICGHTVASLQICTTNGYVKIVARKLDAEAIKLRDKLAKYELKDFKVREGSYSNELIYYNNKGIVFNFNNYRVGTNEDFCTKELLEING